MKDSAKGGSSKSGHNIIQFPQKAKEKQKPKSTSIPKKKQPLYEPDPPWSWRLDPPSQTQIPRKGKSVPRKSSTSDILGNPTITWMQ